MKLSMFGALLATTSTALAVQVQDIGFFPGALGTVPAGVDGEVRSISMDTYMGGETFVSRKWTAGQGYSSLPGPGWAESYRSSNLSRDGTTYLGTAANASHLNGFLVRGQSVIDMGQQPGFLRSYPAGISYDGRTVIGNALLGDINRYTDELGRGFIWREGHGYTNLYAPDGFYDMYVEGLSGDGSAYIATKWQERGPDILFRNKNGVTTDFPANFFWHPTINRDGSRIGVTDYYTGLWIWKEESGMEFLGPFLFERKGTCQTMNPDGTVIAGYDDQHEAFYWRRGLGVKNLNFYLRSLDPRNYSLWGWNFNDVVAVSDDGLRMMGRAEHHGVPTLYIATVPEPSSVLAFGGGLVSILVLRKRKATTS